MPVLQGRVSPEIKARAHRGAAARGISIARYLELLVAADELADTEPAVPEGLPFASETGAA